MSTIKKFVHNIGVSGVANVSSTLRNILLLPILTKTLGAELYGIWAQIMVTIAMIMPLALLQLEYAMTRFLTAEKDTEILRKGVYSIFTAMLISACLFSILIFVFAEPIANNLFGGSFATIFVQITALLVLLTTMDQIIYRYFISFGQISKYSILVLLQNIFEVILIALIVLNGYGLLWALLPLILVRISIFIYGFVVVKSQVKMILPSFTVLKPYLIFSLPLIPFTISWIIMSSGDRYIIGYFLGPTQVGIYSASYVIGSVISFLYTPISLVFLPTITKLYEEKSDELRTHLKFTFKLFLLLALPALFGVSALSQPLLMLLTTSTFTGTFFIVIFVAIGDLFFGFSNIFSNILMLSKKTKLISASYLVSAVINVLLNLILVPLIGITGAALSTLSTFFILFLLMDFFSSKEMSIDWDPKFTVKCIFASIIMVLFLFKFNFTGLKIIISIFLGIIIYFIVLIVIKGIGKEEYMLLKRLVGKQGK